MFIAVVFPLLSGNGMKLESLFLLLYIQTLDSLEIPSHHPAGAMGATSLGQWVGPEWW